MLTATPQRAETLSDSDIASALSELSAPAPSPAPHFLERKDVARLPLNTDSEDGPSPVAAASSHGVFETLRQQFSNAATFDLGRVDLSEHFSMLEDGIYGNEHPRREHDLSASELAMGLAELLNDTSRAAAASPQDHARSAPVSWDHKPTAPETPARQYQADQHDEDEEEAEPPDEAGQRPSTHDHQAGDAQPIPEEENSMASSILDLERRLGRPQRMAQQAPATAPAQHPLPSRAIASAKSRAARAGRLSSNVRGFGAIDYAVPGDFTIIAQPKPNACWATVFTMMLAWKAQQSWPIADSLRTVGQRWERMFIDDTGLGASDKVDFLSDAGLVARPPQSYPVEGWVEMLRTYGPLWVTTDERAGSGFFAIHARILTAMSGDGTPAGTTMHFIDPAGGRRSQESFSRFVQKYESEASTPGTPLRTIVLHWPQGARTMSLSRNHGSSRAFDIPRGIRNNNPGNLRISSQAWLGKVPHDQNTDGAFEQFTSFAYGVRALIKLLRNYIRGGRNTVRRIVNAYAPASDGNYVDSYVRFTVERLSSGGVQADADTVLQANRTTIRLLSQAVGRMENGIEAISDTQFLDGFALLSAEDQASMSQSLGEPEADPYAGFGEDDTPGQLTLRRPWPSQPFGLPSDVDDIDSEERPEDGHYARMLQTDAPAFCSLNSAEDAHSAHFQLSEFTSRDGIEPPRSIRGNIQDVMDNLEVLRAEVGRPIRINSGFRSIAHNEAVGGKPRSRHLCGQAADITIQGMTPQQVHDTIKRLMDEGRMRPGGLGLYSSFVHYDVRGVYTPWGG